MRLLCKTEMFAEWPVGLERICGDNSQLANTARKMCAYKRDELVAGIWIYPDAVLEMEECSPLQKFP